MRQLEDQLTQADDVRLYRRTLALLMWGRGSNVTKIATLCRSAQARRVEVKLGKQVRVIFGITRSTRGLRPEAADLHLAAGRFVELRAAHNLGTLRRGRGASGEL